MNIKKVFTFALAGALSISMLAGCGSSSNESTTSESKEDTSLTDVQAAGHFTLGLDADFAPMGFTDDNGEIVGFDIDLAKAVGEKMGVDVEVKPIDWDSKDMELSSVRLTLSGTVSQSQMKDVKKFFSLILIFQQSNQSLLKKVLI